MSNVITTGSSPKALREGIRTWFNVGYNQNPLYVEKLFDKVKSTRAYEEDVSLASFTLAVEKPEGGQIAYQSEKQGILVRTQHKGYALGFIITHEAKVDNKYAEVFTDRTARLGRAFRETKEITGHAIYNNAFSAVRSTGDGVALCSTSHPLAYGGTWSNRLASDADFAETSLETMLIQISKAKDDEGHQIALKAKRLIIPSELQFEAQRVLKSQLSTTIVSSTNTNAINAFNNLGIDVVSSPYLTDADAWFLMTNTQTGKGLVHFVREEISFNKDVDTSNTLDEYNNAYERYSFNWIDPRHLYGTTGA